MINIEKFIQAQKTSWIRKLLFEEPSWKRIIVALIPNIHLLHHLGSEYALSLCKNINNDFWVEVFQSFNMYAKSCSVRNRNEFLQESILFNPNILIGNKVINNKTLIEHDIFAVANFINNNGKTLSLRAFNEKYYVRLHFLEYNGILKAISKYEEKVTNDETTAENNAASKQLFLTLLQKHKKCCRIAYKKLMANKTNPACCNKWKTIMGKPLNWTNIFKQIKKSSIDSKLRWFQIRLLHFKIPTNNFLYTCKIRDNADCYFCEIKKETTGHLFWECKVVNTFWRKLEEIINNTYINIYHFKLTKELIIFGTTNNFRSDPVLDLIILLAKFHIYRCKIMKKSLRIERFIYEMKERYQMEEINAKISTKINLFNKNWSNYLPIIS